MLKYLFNRHSLVTRLIWLNILAVIAVSVLIGFWTRYTVIEDSLRLGTERQKVLNQRMSNRIDSELVQRKDLLYKLASQLSLLGELKPLAEIQQILDNRVWFHNIFNGGLVVIGHDGKTLLDSPVLEQRIGIFVGDREYFLSSQEYKKPFVSKPIIGRATKEPVYIISSPILDAAGNFLGSITGITKLKDDAILQQVAEGYLGESSHVYILDTQSQLIVTSSRKNLIMQPLAELQKSNIIQKVVQGDFSGQSNSHFGGDVIYSASILNETGWLVINTYTASEWSKHANNLIKEILWISLILTVIIILLSVYYLRRQLLPLDTTTKTLTKMSQPGIKVKPIKIYYNDELGALIHAFNGLINQLNANESEILIASEKAEAANRAKTQFLSNVSHEIKTPLNAVLALTHIQLEHTFDYENRLRLQKIQRSGHALLALVNDIFSFIELENKSVTSTITNFNLENTLSNLVQEYSDLHTDKPIEVFFEIERNIPINLQGDSRHLLQVLGHLLNNAIKFTQNGHVGIQVKQLLQTNNLNTNSLMLQFYVIDTGQGISEEKLGQLFEAFKQLDESNRRTYGGIGMGLAISNKLIHLMGGDDINVKSELGKGSCFYFTLPLIVDVMQHNLSKKTINWDNNSNCSALLIDDQEIYHNILGSILADWSIPSDSANSLDVAFEKINHTLEYTEPSVEDSKCYGLIFLDWSLPNTEGAGALKKLELLYQEASINKTVKKPLIFIMAPINEAESIEFFSETVYPIIHKPISRSQVFDAINQEVYGQRLNQGNRPNKATANVLIVDDNHVNREVVATLLKKYQLKYDTANNGLEAVEQVKKQHYDLILMDLQMPVMDGYEATQKIRIFNKEVPIIALTATAFDKDRLKSFEVGMNAFLTKPVEPKLFYYELSNYLDFMDTAPIQQATAPFINNNQGKQARQRILIVDDEVANLKILANTLNKDYIVQVANQGARALELCNGEAQPDLVLLDIQMPNMDGYEVCRLLKENPATSRIPVIFVTALSTPQSEEKGLSIGAVDYITKPYQMAVVQARIRNHINLKQKTDLLEQLSYLDGLTNIANRRHFDMTLENEINRLQRSNQCLGLIMIDIDYFKPYNDNYGHGKGDECLQQVAKALSDKIERSSDLLARYGGEEFVVISPETDTAGITALAEKLRATIDNLQLPHDHSAIADHITISLGCIAQEVKRSTRADTLLKQVDDALYEAKKLGRNQVVLAQ